jgi:hypothetical protein
MVHRNASVPKYTIPKSKPEWLPKWNLQVRCRMIWCMPLWNPTDHLARFQLDLVTSWQSLGVHHMIQWRLKWPPKCCVSFDLVCLLWHPTDHLARFQLNLVTSWQSLGVHRMIRWRLKWPPKCCVSFDLVCLCGTQQIIWQGFNLT